jgi:methylenetetrahydrofolate dehydrogenase (NADP+)/methenyltetrahydrofolate cyclohydrolase
VTAVLDGRKIAAGIRAEVAASVAALDARGVACTLAIVVATDDESSAWYVRSLSKAAEKLGLHARIVDLGAKATGDELAGSLRELAADASVHGIILQTPLPDGVRGDELASLIPVEKDIDGASPLSSGRLVAGLPAFAPATAASVMELLRAYAVPLRGARAVVVGRSMVVGKPVAHLLLGEDATVTICHSKTRDLPQITQQADILIAAIGRPRFIGREHVREGAVVIDVGTTPDEHGSLIGDVDAAELESVAGAVSPVPGGVGPVTTALLLRHTVTAALTSVDGAA